MSTTYTVLIHYVCKSTSTPPSLCLLTHSHLSSSRLSSVCLASDKPLERRLVETASTNSLCYQANRILFLQPMLKMASLDMRRKRWCCVMKRHCEAEKTATSSRGINYTPLLLFFPDSSSLPSSSSSSFFSYSMKISSLFLGMGSNGMFRWEIHLGFWLFQGVFLANEMTSQATSVFMNT